MKKKTILFFLGSGGHFEQARRLISLMGNKFNYELVYISGDNIAKKKIKKLVKEKNITVTKDYFVPKIRITKDSKIKNFLYLFYGAPFALILSLLVPFRTKAKVFVSAGSGSVVPIYYMGKILQKKLIYIESWSRVWTPSLTGRLLYPIVDLFFIQWKELKKRYPKAIYTGRFG